MPKREVYEYIVNQCLVKEGQLATRSEMGTLLERGGCCDYGCKNDGELEVRVD